MRRCAGIDGGGPRDVAGRTVVIGVGNLLRTDDGVGLRVARELRPLVAGRGDVDVVEIGAGGMTLMEASLGFDRAVIVDAMTGGGVAGTVYEVGPEDLGETRNSACAHSTDLRTAIDVARWLALPLPREIAIGGIEPGDVETVGETLTPGVESAVPRVVAGIIRALELPPSRGEAE